MKPNTMQSIVEIRSLQRNMPTRIIAKDDKAATIKVCTVTSGIWSARYTDSMEILRVILRVDGPVKKLFDKNSKSLL
jgi:hypothetical protein